MNDSNDFNDIKPDSISFIVSYLNLSPDDVQPELKILIDALIEQIDFAVQCEHVYLIKSALLRLSARVDSYELKKND